MARAKVISGQALFFLKGPRYCGSSCPKRGRGDGKFELISPQSKWTIRQDFSTFPKRERRAGMLGDVHVSLGTPRRRKIVGTGVPNLFGVSCHPTPNKLGTPAPLFSKEVLVFRQSRFDGTICYRFWGLDFSPQTPEPKTFFKGAVRYEPPNALRLSKDLTADFPAGARRKTCGQRPLLSGGRADATPDVFKTPARAEL
jgi:hypothetical protein